MSQPALNIRLDYEPRDWQKQCHRDRLRFTVLALHRRAGKTELAIMELIDKALQFKLDLGLFFYVAPYLKQAKAIAWARLKQKLAPLVAVGAVDVNESELSIKIKSNGALIRIFGGDNPDAMRGVRLDGVVVDEVAQIKPEVWQDIIQPALSDRKGWALFIGTPSGINLFSELFFRSAALPDWHSARYTINDTQSIDADEVERLRRDMAETSFQREYLCDFSAAGDDQLISLTDVEQASRIEISNQDLYYAPVIVGVDPARFGDDRSVIVIRQGLKMYEPIVLRGIDNMALAARVAAVIDDKKPDAVFIDAGAGSGVIDRLRQLGHDVVEIAFAGKPIDERYLNKRAEMWWAIRDWLTAGGAIPNDTGLKQDLAAPTYFYNTAGKIQIESKEEIKKRGLPSPDMADALALTFAFPVAPRSDVERLGLQRNKTHQQRGHDPFARLN
jgi:hypothetical protein